MKDSVDWRNLIAKKLDAGTATKHPRIGGD